MDVYLHKIGGEGGRGRGVVKGRTYVYIVGRRRRKGESLATRGILIEYFKC